MSIFKSNNFLEFKMDANLFSTWMRKIYPDISESQIFINYLHMIEENKN